MAVKTIQLPAAVASMSSLGITEVSHSLAATGFKDTGWVTMPLAARSDVFVIPTELGGNGTNSPAYGHLSLLFR